MDTLQITTDNDLVTFETYADMFVDPDEAEENENYDSQLREFTVPREWAAEWVSSFYHESLDEFMSQYTWDDTDQMYNFALLENVLDGMRIIDRE